MELVSIHENKNFTRIQNDIFIKENFIKEEDYSRLLVKTESLTEEDWNTHPTDDQENGRISVNLHETFAVSQEIIELVIPKYWINEHKTVNRMRVKDLGVPFGWNDWSAADYAVVFYFGEFSGGSLRCYKHGDPENFTVLEVKPNVLYLLPISDLERYTSEPVESGIKYSFVDWIYRHPEWSMA
jgi:hypothetical protein